MIKWYDGKMLTLDRMLSITQEGGDKRTVNLRHTPTFSEQHFIDRILRCPNGSSMFCFEISIGEEERLDGMPKNALGMGHGVRVGVSIGSYGDNIISQNDQYIIHFQGNIWHKGLPRSVILQPMSFHWYLELYNSPQFSPPCALSG